MALNNFVVKLREARAASSPMDRSPPGLAPRAKVKRSASAPNISTQSSGSMPLPLDLLIF
ncbi:Uncharacterised protein [Mycobacteroides abscessus subsp. abscessus]|nr:Uncharacterised protein [Mycobacteroides abscessus subsp. abscessus]